MPQHSLEQEAMDRVRRMYSPFGGTHVGSADASRQSQTAPQTQKSEPKPESPGSVKEVTAEKSVSENPSKQNSLLELFLKDKDESLILLLLVLLMKDGADMNLMLALMYLLI